MVCSLKVIMSLPTAHVSSLHQKPRIQDQDPNQTSYILTYVVVSQHCGHQQYHFGFQRKSHRSKPICASGVAHHNDGFRPGHSSLGQNFSTKKPRMVIAFVCLRYRAKTRDFSPIKKFRGEVSSPLWPHFCFTANGFGGDVSFRFPSRLFGEAWSQNWKGTVLKIIRVGDARASVCCPFHYQTNEPTSNQPTNQQTNEGQSMEACCRNKVECTKSALFSSFPVMRSCGRISPTNILKSARWVM